MPPVSTRAHRPIPLDRIGPDVTERIAKRTIPSHLPEHWHGVGEPTDPCQHWDGQQTALGYGTITIWGTTWLVHRIVYADHYGTDPGGLTIDHLCNIPACIEPTHLEAVTYAENSRRSQNVGGLNALRTHCPAGHPLQPNPYEEKKRWCKPCNAERSAKRYATLKKAREVTGLSRIEFRARYADSVRIARALIEAHARGAK